MSTEDREGIERAIAGVMHDIDDKRWDELRARFADDVETDYTSLFGGAPQRQSGDALIAAWQGALAKVATHHQLGPIVQRVEGAHAHAECHVRGMHLAARAPGGSWWEVLGHYWFELVRQERGAWRIARMRLLTHVQLGNTKLLAEASEV
jgi:hypothetical protein